jgi:hypothetical protein
MYAAFVDLLLLNSKCMDYQNGTPLCAAGASFQHAFTEAPKSTVVQYFFRPKRSPTFAWRPLDLLSRNPILIVAALVSPLDGPTEIRFVGFDLLQLLLFIEFFQIFQSFHFLDLGQSLFALFNFLSRHVGCFGSALGGEVLGIVLGHFEVVWGVLFESYKCAGQRGSVRLIFEGESGAVVGCW